MKKLWWLVGLFAVATLVREGLDYFGPMARAYRSYVDGASAEVRARRGDARFEGIEAVIFDMDGVLVDSEPLHMDATRRLLATYGVGYSQEANEEFIGFTDVEIFTILRARHGLLPGTDVLARQFAEHLIALLRREAVPLPGVPVS